MTLLNAYYDNLNATHRQPDLAQINVIEHYQSLLTQILEHNLKKEKQAAVHVSRLTFKHFLTQIRSIIRPNLNQEIWQPNSQGLYVWGSVGRGKTYLMDLFFNYIQLPKSRYHYHHFMQMIHKELRQLKDQTNPLARIANNIAKTTQILCLDEFFVVDITDAMILSKLLECLFQEKVYLVTTSNCIPEQLYRNGLQRERFIPTIRLIQTQMNVISLDSDIDYRLRHLEQMTVWSVTQDPSFLADLFLELNAHAGQGPTSISLNDRDFAVLNLGTHTLHCDFKALCIDARSAMDYIEIAGIYHHVLIANIPQFNPQQNNEARRFITMIDEFYDRGVKIAVSAACDIIDLYQGTTLSFEFERTISRLIEMQSKAYLSRDHLHSIEAP